MEHEIDRGGKFDDILESEATGGQPKVYDSGTTPGRAGRVRTIYRNSKSFRLLERLFNTNNRKRDEDENQKLERLTMTNSEYRAMHRLVVDGLVARSEESCSSCNHVRVQYSITLMGRAHYIASKLGLSFPQLCYLACARKVMRHPFYQFSEMFPWTEAVDGPFANVFLRQVRGKDVVIELSRKGFLEIYAGRAADWGPRFRDVEAHGTFLEELFAWLRSEGERALLDAACQPTNAKIAQFFTGVNTGEEKQGRGQQASP